MTTATTYTVKQRSAFYESQKGKRKYLGGGIGALLVVGGLADKSFDAVSGWVRAGFLLSTILAGAIIGLSYILYDARLNDLQRWVAQSPGRDENSDIPTDKKYKKNYSANILFLLGGLLMLLSAGLLIYAAVEQARQPEVEACKLQFSPEGQVITCVND